MKSSHRFVGLLLLLSFGITSLISPLYLDGHWLDATGSHGRLGVQLFFVISGFVLPYALFGRGYQLRHFFTFVAKRVVRLDPPYLVTILVVVLASYLGSVMPGFTDEFTMTWPQVLGHLAYLNAFLDLPWLVNVFWTLAIEFQFYLVIGVTYPLLAHSNPVVRFACLATLYAVSAFFPHDAFVPAKPFVFQHIFLFGMGILTFWRQQNLVGPLSFLVSIAASAAATFWTLGAGAMVAGLVATFLIAYVPDRRLGGVALEYLGKISYSLYLVHVPVGALVFRALEPVEAIPRLGVVLIGVGASLLVADLLYRFVERPSQNFSSSLRYR